MRKTKKMAALILGLMVLACTGAAAAENKLPVIPAFQGKGIGTSAMEFVKSYYRDWKRFTLVTPVDKSENVRFYTEKCGFDIQSVEMDGNVKVARFILER